MSNIFADEAWADYTDWQIRDKKIAMRINEHIIDINRNGLNQGIGKPEPLRYRKAWSRRITHEHRLVYNFDENKNLIILSCKGHYENNK